jgi:hypothetical protein
MNNWEKLMSKEDDELRYSYNDLYKILVTVAQLTCRDPVNQDVKASSEDRWIKDKAVPVKLSDGSVIILVGSLVNRKPITGRGFGFTFVKAPKQQQGDQT